MVGKVGKIVPQSKLMLIDGNSLLYRAFFALPLLHTREGIYTNGVYGFLTMVNRVLAEQQPTHVLVAFDKDRHTFRNEVYADYKANRPDTPDELSGQFALLRKILEALNLDYTEIEGYEADDIIGTLSRMAEEAGMETLILTGDRDSLQLVSDKVTVLMTKKGITEMETYTPEKVKERWGVSPEQLIDVKGLMGDSSDNIPGVPGVGEKTAVKLIQEFGSLENLYDHLEAVKVKKVVERLSQHREQAFMSRKLGRIIRDIDMQCDLEDYRRKNPDLKTVRELYHKLEFNSLLQSLEEKTDQPQAYWDDKVVAEELKDEDQTARFIAALGENQNTGVLIEADYHHPMWAKIHHFYITTEDKVYHLEVGEKSTYKLEWLRPYLEAPYLPKVFHNAKFAQVLLKRYGINLQGIKGDTLLGAYVYDPSFDGEQLVFTVQKFLNRTVEKDNHLQNIPIRMEEGRRIRKAFVAPREDWMIVSADYSQIDLRSLAHISEDEILIDTFRQGIDIHTRTASEIFQVPLDKVTADLRYRAKAVNFGIIYGISDFGLARDTGVSRKEAKQYIEKYLSSYPGVRPAVWEKL
jgi:DNA polymerase-1